MFSQSFSIPSIGTAAEIRAVVQSMTERIGTAGAGQQRQALGTASPGQVESLVAPSSSRGSSRHCARIILDAHHDDGVPWDRIAVIARRGARVSSLTSSLAAHGVPARTAMAGMTLIDEPAARALVDMVALGRGVLPLTSATAVNALAGVYGGMTQQELRALRFALRVAADPDEPYQPADQMIADALRHRGGFALVPVAVSRKAQRVATILDDIRSALEDSPVVDLLWRVWDGSPAATQWAEAVQSAGANPPAERALDAVVALFRQAADFVENQPGANPELFVDALLGAEIPDDVLIPEPAWPSVVVSTPPGVAGREFDLVIVAGLEEGVWPDLRPRESLLGAHHMVHAHRGVPGEILDERRAVLDDELRVFVLALSRATTRIVATVTHDEESGPSPLYSLLDRQATRLESTEEQPASIPGVVGGLRRKLQQALEKGEDGKPYAHDLALLHERGLRGAHPESWWVYWHPRLKRRSIQRVLSRCPRRPSTLSKNHPSSGSSDPSRATTPPRNGVWAPSSTPHSKNTPREQRTYCGAAWMSDLPSSITKRDGLNSSNAVAPDAWWRPSPTTSGITRRRVGVWQPRSSASSSHTVEPG